MILAGTLGRRLRRIAAFRPAPAAPETTAPLLDAAEIGRLIDQARHWPIGAGGAEVHEHHAGDWPSASLGRGLDFEEARPYAAGDDLRDMDWRSTARLGHPFVKTYREERQPSWHIVVDHGPSMRFGTRRRLKVAQAARLGVLLAYAASHAGIAVGASVWSDQDQHFGPCHGDAAILERVRAMTAGCPPQPPGVMGARAGGGGLADRLRLLRATVPRGAHLWLISDGCGLDEAAAHAVAMLGEATRLHLLLVHDPAEQALPDIGRAAFLGAADGETRWLDTGDGELRRRMAEAWAARRRAQAQLLARCRASLRDFATTDDDLPAAWLGRGGGA